MSKMFLFCFASLWLSLPAFTGEVEVMVVGDRVNLRTESGLDSDIIGQVNYGDMLEAVEFEGEWVRVRPPEHLAFWVHGGLLFEEREVRSRVLNVRAGPGTQFSAVGQLNRGDPVTVRESHEDWRRIDTPDAVTLWISAQFVERRDPLPDPVEEAEMAEDAEEDVESVDDVEETGPEDADAEVDLDEEEEEPEVVTVVEIETVERIVEVPVVPTPTPTVVPPPDLDLVPLQGQGTASVRRGVVKAYLIAGTAPSRFQLVHREGGHEVPLAYLMGDEELIRNANGRQVLVRGRDFWVSGRRVPVTRVESLELTEGGRE